MANAMAPQQAGAHIMVIGIQAENVGVLFGHRHSRIVGILIEKNGRAAKSGSSFENGVCQIRSAKSRL